MKIQVKNTNEQAENVWVELSRNDLAYVDPLLLLLLFHIY